MPAVHSSGSRSCADLVVFAGAGISVCEPAALPDFRTLKDAILEAAGIAKLPDADRRTSLAPEPFMAALGSLGFDVEAWLRDVLSKGKPNAAHLTIAELLHEGASVWTVNFDELIEQAYLVRAMVPPSRCAWPDTPSSGARLLKPHGTLSGAALIVRSQQVVQSVAADWVARLRDDVRDKVVAIVGYSGRDIDLAPVLGEAFAAAVEVRWFDFPLRDEDRERREQLLSRVAHAGKLRLVDCPRNPSRDFIDWCARSGYCALPDPSVLRALEPPSRGATVIAPALPPLAQALILDLLGEHRKARKAMLERLVTTHDGSAARLLVEHLMNYGGLRFARGAAIVQLVPPVTPSARRWRVRVRRKRLTAYQKAGYHESILRMTARHRSTDTSTEVGLRSAALRPAGRLDEAVAAGAKAAEMAREEGHPARLVHAVFQHAIALTWAGRTDEAEALLVDVFRPLAEITNARWIAWSHYVAGSVDLLRGRPREASEELAVAEAVFRAELSREGVRAVHENSLVMARLAGDEHGFRRVRERLIRLPDDPALADGWTYARRTGFSEGFLEFEEAEFDRVFCRCPDAARARYEGLLSSRYPVLRVLASLGLAAQAPASERAAAARAVIAIANQVGAKGLVGQAERLAGGSSPVSTPIIFTP